MSAYPQRQERIGTPEGDFHVEAIDPVRQRAHLTCLTTGATKTVPLATMRRNLSDGIWHRLNVRLVTGVVRDLTVSDAARKRHALNLAIVEQLKTLIKGGLSKAEAIRSLAGKKIELAEGKTVDMIPERSAYRLLAAAETAPLEMLPAYAERGNRKKRYSEEVEDFVLDLIDEHFARVHSRITMRNLAELASVQARERGLLNPSERLSRAYITKLYTTYRHADLDHKRLDPRVARAAKHVAMHRIHVDAPLQRVEQDGHVIPMVVKTPEGILKNPVILVCIDCATSMPLGWYLTATASTEEDSLQCLEVSLYSKEERFKALSIDCPIDPYGLPGNLIIDNGSENRGQRILGLTEVGMSLNRAPAHSGHRKPFIERLFRSMKSDLQVLPGSTRFKDKDGMRTEAAMQDELMTLEQLEIWIVRWLYERWIHKKLRRFVTASYATDKAPGVTPAERWTHYSQTMLVPFPPSRDLWARVRYLCEERSISPKTGASVRGFNFRGDHLPRLIAQYGENAHVPVYYNPSDYRFAYVPDKETKELRQLVNTEVRPETPAFSFDEATKRHRHVLRSSAKTPPQVEKFHSDLAKAALAPQKRKASHTEQQRAVREAVKLSKSIEGSRKKPITDPVESTPGRLWTDDLPLTDDAIPTLEVRAKPAKPRTGGGA